MTPAKELGLPLLFLSINYHIPLCYSGSMNLLLFLLVTKRLRINSQPVNDDVPPYLFIAFCAPIILLSAFVMMGVIPVEWWTLFERKETHLLTLVVTICYPKRVMNKTITVTLRLSNGAREFRTQIPGLENVPLVTLQDNNEIRWAATGPMSAEHAEAFYDALRLALTFANDGKGHRHAGVTFEMKYSQ